MGWGGILDLNIYYSKYSKECRIKISDRSEHPHYSYDRWKLARFKVYTDIHILDRQNVQGLFLKMTVFNNVTQFSLNLLGRLLSHFNHLFFTSNRKIVSFRHFFLNTCLFFCFYISS